MMATTTTDSTQQQQSSFIIVDYVFTGVNLVFLSLMGGLHLKTWYQSKMNQQQLPKMKHYRIANRIKTRTSMAAVCVCVLEVIVLVMAINIALISQSYVHEKRLLPIYRILLLLIDIVSIIGINEIFLGVARVYCSCILIMVSRRLPDRIFIAKRLQKFLIISEIVLLSVGVVPKIAADINYFFHSVPEVKLDKSRHSRASTLFKQISDRVFDAGITCNGLIILVCALSFSCYFARHVDQGKRVVYRTQGLVCSFNIYSLLRTLLNMLFNSILVNYSFIRHTWIYQINVLLHCCLMAVQLFLIRDISDYSHWLLRSEIDHLDRDETRQIKDEQQDHVTTRA